MDITLLIDRNFEGYAVYLAAGVRELGWDQLIRFEFKRLRDFGLPDDCPDDEIWRFVQAQQLLLITHNRNSKDETSLQAQCCARIRPPHYLSSPSLTKKP